jgi:hypothetical protein
MPLEWQNSDQTDVKQMMRQWCNSDAFDLGIFMSIASFRDVIDPILSFCNALEEWLLIWWWNKTFWQKQWCNSDETVMEQWYDSDATVMPLI